MTLGIAFIIAGIFWLVDEKLLDFKKTIPYFAYVAFFDLILIVIIWIGSRETIEFLKYMQISEKMRGSW